MPTPTPIRFQATLHRPATPKGAAWRFVVLPHAASAKLPTRAMVSVQGTLAGQAFAATLSPDGSGSHWLKVGKALLAKAGVEAGGRVTVALAPVATEPEPRVPPDLRAALAGNAAARATWGDITPVARRDWIAWMTSGKQAATRGKRIATGCDMLAKGKRRACCFDRSGMVGKGTMGPPPAAD